MMLSYYQVSSGKDIHLYVRGLTECHKSGINMSRCVQKGLTLGMSEMKCAGKAEHQRLFSTTSNGFEFFKKRIIAQMLNRRHVIESHVLTH
jgi:hypothetical protein